MLVPREDIEKARQVILKDMDTIIRYHIGDEDVLEGWLMGGLPDGYDQEDLDDIAADDDMWIGVVECFTRCCRRAGFWVDKTSNL